MARVKQEKSHNTMAMPLSIGVSLAKEVVNNANTTKAIYEELTSIEPRVTKIEEDVTNLSKSHNTTSEQVGRLVGKVKEVAETANMYRIVSAEESLFKLENEMKEIKEQLYSVCRENKILHNSLLRITLNESSSLDTPAVPLSPEIIEKIKTAQRISMCNELAYKKWVNSYIRMIASKTDLTIGAVWRNTFIALVQLEAEDESYSLDVITNDKFNRDLRFLYAMILLDTKVADIKQIRHYLSFELNTK